MFRGIHLVTSGPVSDELEPDELEAEVLKPGIYVTGKNGKILVTEEDVRLAFENTTSLLEKGQLQSPNKLGHDNDQSATQKMFPSGGGPGIGWLRSLRLEGTSLFARYKNVPEKFKQWLREGLYGPRSVELDMNFQKEDGSIATHVVTGLAWLGERRPAIQSLSREILGVHCTGLAQFSAENNDVAEGELIEDEKKASAELLEEKKTEQPKREFTGEGVKQMTPEEIAALQAKLSAAEDRAKTAEQSRDALKKGTVTSRVTALSGVRLVPGDVDTMVETALHLDGAPLEKFLASLEARPLIDNGTSQKGSSKEDGAPGDKKLTGEAKIMADAQAILADSNRQAEYVALKGRKMTLGDALCFAAEEDPEADKLVATHYGLTKASATFTD